MKGMDLSVYRELAPVAHTWRIHEATTHKELFIPFKSIAVLIEAKCAKEADIGYGRQVFIPLDRFSDVGKPPLNLPAIQKELFKV